MNEKRNKRKRGQEKDFKKERKTESSFINAVSIHYPCLV